MDSICQDRIVMMYQPEYTNAQVFPITFGHIAKPCGLAIWVTMIRYEDPEWRKSAGLDAHLPDIIDPWDSLPQWKKPDNYDIFGPLDARGRVPISAYRAGQGLFVWWKRNVLRDVAGGTADSFRTFVLNDMKTKISYWNTDMWCEVLDVLFPKENTADSKNNSRDDTPEDLPE
tara:strand:- start:300 stop:818 length:519 start_codon:yes stop_codon:yes gene_type:complete